MPIPLIVWGVVAGGCAVAGAVSAAFAAGRLNDAQNKYKSRRKRYEEAMQQWEIGVSVHFISFLLKPIDGKLIADGI